MRSIIEELYYGNISPSDRDIIRGGTYSHILNLVTRNEDELVQTLTQAQQETFEKFKDCASELGDKNEMMSFVLGIKISGDKNKPATATRTDTVKYTNFVYFTK